jgi:hypothetical protein
MRQFDQIAVPVSNICDASRFYNPDTEWVHDRVTAVILHHRFVEHVATDFECRLAFNYDVVAFKEFELIQFMSGSPIQVCQFKPEERRPPVGHLGYHVEKDVTLESEILRWARMGFRLAQVARTVKHENPNVLNRYEYAFIDTTATCGLWVKLIKRIPLEGYNLEEEIRRFEAWRKK